MPYDIIDIPLHAGLDTKTDEKGLNPPGLLRAQDVQFDDTGGIQTRPQYQPIADAAGNTIDDIRKVVAYGDELVAFSKDKLWSYASGDGLWTERSEYLAVKVDEEPRFVSTAEQFDCDRVEKDGVAFFSWSETTPSGTASYVAAIDVATGAVKLSPTAIKAGATRARLVTTTNKVCLVYAVLATPAIWVRMYDPSDLSSSELGTTLSGAVGFDATQDENSPATVLVVTSRGTQYSIHRFSETPGISAVQTKARAVDGAMFVATGSATSNICVGYSVGTAVRADILDSALADDSVNSILTAYSTTVNQIAGAYDGNGTCHIFASSNESTGNASFGIKSGTVDNDGNSGTPADLVHRCGIASRAFRHDGSAYVWVAFAQVSVGDLVAQLQNSYFLYRDDGLLVAKALTATAGGFSASEGYLPGVQNISGDTWAWCGSRKAIIAIGQGQKGYAARSPHEILSTFDSDEARRTTELGKTLYVSGGQLMQYDGVNLVEVGFHTYPWDTGALPGAAGNPDGSLNYHGSYSWQNNKGERERGTSVSLFDANPVSQKVALTGSPLHLTAKTGAAGEVAAEFWRQVDGAPVGAPSYLVTSKDPSASGDNGYVENDPDSLTLASVTDDLSDDDLVRLEPWHEAGGQILESLAPTPAAILVSTQDRVMLAGIPGEPTRIAYSKLRGIGEVASFNDRLTVDLPPDGGVVTSLAFLGETLIAFKESAIYALPGDGYDNAGGGQNYGPARVLPTDVGAVSHEAVALTPLGLLFQSFKGWYLLGHGWQVRYVGGAVADFDDEEVLSMEVMKSQHQVRILTESRTLVWDYLLAGSQQSATSMGQWATWTTSGTDSVIWNGIHHIVNSGDDGLLAQASDHSGSGDLPQLDVETGWIKTGGLQGMGLVRKVLVLGEYLAAHDLRLRVAYNYVDTWVDDKTWTVSPAEVGPLQMEHGLSRPKCESVKFRITAQAVGSATAPTTKALNLTGLSLEIKRRKNHFGKGMGAARKQ